MDVSSLKVTELRRELRARGLSAAGDKAQLAARLEVALDADAEARLDADPLDADFDLTALDGPTEPAEPSAAVAAVAPSPISVPANGNADASESEPPAKKIAINRTTIPTAAPVSVSVSATAPAPASKADNAEPVVAVPSKGEKIALGSSSAIDAKTRLEMRAKRFGLTPGAEALKEARKARFGLAAASAAPSAPSTPSTDDSSADLDALKKRAERFGGTPSKTTVDAENELRLLRRKERFGTAAS